MEYKISKNEIRIIDKDFRRYASRLLKTKYGNEIKDLTRFLNYIAQQPLLISFIEKNNIDQFDIKVEISSKDWNDLYDIPIDEAREIAWVYQFLIYCQENIKDFWIVTQGYGSSSRSIQDHIDAFCHEVIKPFIDHITDYIGEVMIEMGIDENAKLNIQITGGNGQVNVSTGSSTINAVNNVSMTANDIKTIIELANKFMELVKEETSIDSDTKEMILDDVEVIKEQVDLETPKLPRLKKALASIKGIKGVLANGTSIMIILNSLTTQVDTFINTIKGLG
jgi:hypothetical protein